jgi:predicted phage terminase large subunit-like protein
VEQIASEHPPTGPNGIRKLLGRDDPEFFARAYFPAYFNSPVPQFHKEMYKIMRNIFENESGKKMVMAAPRGHSKSTLWSFAFPLWCILYQKKRHIITLSVSASLAIDFLANMKFELTSNQSVLEDFGKLQGQTWREDKIVTKTDIVVSAKGSGMAIRGARYKHIRPDLLILDDIQDKDAMESKLQRDKLFDWYARDVKPLGDSGTDIIIVGNVVHYADLLSDILDNRPGYQKSKYQAIINWSTSPLWDDDWKKIYTDKNNKNAADDAKAFFEENREEMMAGVETIWPERKTYYDYMVDITDDGLAPFLAELQNDPIDPSQQWISPDDFQYYGGKDEPELPPPSELTFKGSVDPSMGKGKKSDFSAICTVARDSAGFLYVVDSNAERRHPDKITNDILDLAEMYHYEEFAVETIAFQELFSHDLKKAGMAKGIYLNVVEVKPRTDKEIRIMKLQSFIKNGYLKFHRSQKELIDQLVYLGKWANDDQADALEMAVSLFIEHETDFVHTMMPDITGISTKW